MAFIYVVAHDGGYEGHSLPVLAFEDRETAHRWASAQSESYSVAKVPVHPDVPEAPWYCLERDKAP